VNGHTAIIRSFGTTGVLLLLSLVLLAIVSAIVAFDRWPETGRASAVERVAVDRSDVRRVETVRVRSQRPSLVQGALGSSGTSASASGASAFLVAEREPGGQSDGGGLGPPPPPVPVRAPGEGGGGPARVSNSVNSPPAEEPGDEQIIQEAACGAREALGEAGAPLESACNLGQREALEN
jgi:hypothetical protein